MLSSISKTILALFVLLALFATLVDAFPVRDTTLAARHAAVARRQASGSCKPAPATQPDEDDEEEDDEDDDEEEEYDQPAKPATTGRPAASGVASATPPASTGKPANGTTNQSGSAPANLGGSRALFPAGLGNQALTWSTSNKISGALPLSDSTFRLFNNIADLEHPYVNAPDGVRSMRVTYPRGTAALSGRDTPRGGVSFYARGPVDLTRAKEATLSFSVLFQSGFQFNHGGKLPGLYGGESDGGAVSCSGGRQDTSCFSTRFMWRDGGAFEGYFYLPPVAANKNGFCRTSGVSCNDQYGASVSRGAFRFQPGVRTTIAQRVKLNDVGRANGEVEMYHNGQSIRKLTGLVLRNKEAGVIRGIQMQSFFGGHGPYWVSPQTQNSFFGDFSVSITETLP